MNSRKEIFNYKEPCKRDDLSIKLIRRFSHAKRLLQKLFFPSTFHVRTDSFSDWNLCLSKLDVAVTHNILFCKKFKFHQCYCKFLIKMFFCYTVSLTNSTETKSFAFLISCANFWLLPRFIVFYLLLGP